MQKIIFKIGDRVKIVKKSENYMKWNSMGLMDNTIGMTGEIITINNNYARVYLNRDWSYDLECLKLVKGVKRSKWQSIWRDN